MSNQFERSNKSNTNTGLSSPAASSRYPGRPSNATFFRNRQFAISKNRGMKMRHSKELKISDVLNGGQYMKGIKQRGFKCKLTNSDKMNIANTTQSSGYIYRLSDADTIAVQLPEQ